MLPFHGKINGAESNVKPIIDLFPKWNVTDADGKAGLNMKEKEVARMKVSEDQIPQIAPLVKSLWPEHSAEDLAEILKDYVGGEESAVFAAKRDGRIVGAALCCLRHDYVEGCESSPVGYLEGICVDADYRMRGIAASLCRECEDWAEALGCSEFASDCELTNADSLCFHLSVGFREENRIICFRKVLKQPAGMP